MGWRIISSSGISKEEMSFSLGRLKDGLSDRRRFDRIGLIGSLAMWMQGSLPDIRWSGWRR
jgi:hypothetical protein